MKNMNSTTSNKKKAGKGNGNSVINNRESVTNASNYVSGDSTPTSSGHKFNSNSNANKTK